MLEKHIIERSIRRKVRTVGGSTVESNSYSTHVHAEKMNDAVEAHKQKQPTEVAMGPPHLDG